MLPETSSTARPAPVERRKPRSRGYRSYWGLRELWGYLLETGREQFRYRAPARPYYKIGLGKGLRFKQGGSGLYAIPRQRSVDRFKDKVRALTRRRIAVPLEELIRALNPVIRGWGMYYRRANVRRLFNRLNMWIVRRIWGWRFKRWRNAGWRTLPETRLYGEYGLVNLLQLIPSMRDYYRQKGYTH
jgi:RNA-directed DNA polymerase